MFGHQRRREKELRKSGKMLAEKALRAWLERYRSVVTAMVEGVVAR